MKNFLDNTRTSALMTIAILVIGSISGVATAQFVMSSDGGNINGSIIACVYGACKDNTFNGGTSSGGGQPTPTTGKLIVKKVVECPNNPDSCPLASEFTMTVTSFSDGSSQSFPGSATGTTVTLSPGDYQISENVPVFGFVTTFSGDCTKAAPGKADVNIIAGETKTCTFTNTF